MYEDLFLELGLNKNETIIYEFLLKTGQTTAGNIIKNTPIKRGVVYNTLKDLQKKHLVSEENKNKVAYFSPEHPGNLRAFIENREKKLQKARNTLESNISNMVSDFHLVSGRPGLNYYEGEAGIEKILNDSLTSTEVIRTYVDIEIYESKLRKFNEKFAKKREKLNIHKRAIVVDSPFARDHFLTVPIESTNEIRFIDELSPQTVLLQIYDNKIAYISIEGENKLAVLIEDKNIYQMHRAIFEHNWKHATTVEQLREQINKQA